MAGVGIGVGFSYFFLYLTLSLRVWEGGGDSLGRGIFLNFLYTFNFFTNDLYTFAILPIYFFLHRAMYGHFFKVTTQKACGAITYEPLVILHSNLTMWFSRYFR